MYVYVPVPPSVGLSNCACFVLSITTGFKASILPYMPREWIRELPAIPISNYLTLVVNLHENIIPLQYYESLNDKYSKKHWVQQYFLPFMHC